MAVQCADSDSRSLTVQLLNKLTSMFHVVLYFLACLCQMRMFLVEDVHKAGVSCLHWSRNAMKLFSGDGEGRVVCTEIDYTKVSFTRLSVSFIVKVKGKGAYSSS